MNKCLCKIIGNCKTINWFSVSGVSATAIYLLFVYLIIQDRIDFLLLDMPLNEVGDFCAGILGPVAVFWLILGFFQQGRELKLQVRELSNSVKHQKDLADAANHQIKTQQKMVKPQFSLYNFSSSPLTILGFEICNFGGSINNVQIKIDNGTDEVFTKDMMVWRSDQRMNFDITNPAKGDLYLDINYLDTFNLMGCIKYHISFSHGSSDITVNNMVM